MPVYDLSFRLMDIVLPTLEQIEFCSQFVKALPIGTFTGFPYEQGSTSLVFFTQQNGRDYAIKLPREMKAFEIEIANLKRLQKLKLVSVDVPQLITYGRSPAFIMMSRLTGPTIREKLDTGGYPSRTERERVGTRLGNFLAEIYEKTGEIYTDAHHDNVIWTNRLKIIDFGHPLEVDPERALHSLITKPYNFAGPVAARFLTRTGITLDPDRVAALARQSHGDYLEYFEPTIATNLAAWKADLATAAQPRRQSRGQPAGMPPAFVLDNLGRAPGRPGTALTPG